jgi:hypothetical protein
MQNQSTFKPGNSVVKNPTGWISSMSDRWGAGEGVGIVTDLLTEFDDGKTVNVKWPTGSCVPEAGRAAFGYGPSPRSHPASRSHCPWRRSAIHDVGSIDSDSPHR